MKRKVYGLDLEDVAFIVAGLLLFVLAFLVG